MRCKQISPQSVVIWRWNNSASDLWSNPVEHTSPPHPPLRGTCLSLDRPGFWVHVNLPLPSPTSPGVGPVIGGSSLTPGGAGWDWAGAWVGGVGRGGRRGGWVSGWGRGKGSQLDIRGVKGHAGQSMRMKSVWVSRPEGYCPAYECLTNPHVCQRTIQADWPPQAHQIGNNLPEPHVITFIPYLVIEGHL